MTLERKLIIVGQTPPPFNGQAKMISLMIEAIKEEFDPIHIRMAYSDSVVSAGKFGFSKIKHMFCLIRETRQTLRKYPGAVLYYPPASPNFIPLFRDLFFLLSVRNLAAKTVLHFHSGGMSEFVRRNKWLLPFAMKAYGSADVAIELGESCPRDGEFFNAQRTCLVPNGLDVPVNAADQPLRTDHQINILYVGIHTETKGIFDLLETAKELKRRGVDFLVKMAGLWYTPEERARFEALRDQWELTDFVQPVGQKTGDDLWGLYRWADVFFFPTFYAWETFGIVQLEAMAYSLPVVASRWQGPKDVVEDGKTGFLCPIHDVMAFADALQKLAGDDALCTTMGREGRLRYNEKYTKTRYVAGMREIFIEVCS